jgi:hypothetical protein
VDRVLDPPPGTPSVRQEELDVAMTQASDSARAQAFYRARQRRQSTWKTDKARMSLTIPVFRALIAADARHTYHQNHAQLGFALKDISDPKWAEAEEALSEAIRRRGSPDRGWWLYEFNHAICLIHLDPARSGPSAPETRASILRDLQTTARSRSLIALLTQVPEVADWLARNDVAPESLTPVERDASRSH